MNLKYDFYLNTSIIIFFIMLFYITIIYPQKQKIKRNKNILKNLKKNDEIITKGGIIGKIIKIKDKKYITLLINRKNKILINKKYVLNIVPKKTLKKI